MVSTYESASKLIISLASRNDHGNIVPPHRHDRAQLLYAATGSIRVQTVDHVWLVPPKCALWVPAWVEHSVISLSEVYLNTVLVEESAARILGEKCFLVRMNNLLQALVIRINQLNLMQEHDQTYTEDVEKSLQNLIFYEIKQALMVPIEIPWPRDKRLILICEQLIAHPNECKNLNIWADHIGTSSRTLIRLFKKETGLSYRGWLQQMHIVLALGRLARGESIAQISHALGYISPSAFSAMFKRHLGKPPQNFRDIVH